MAVILLSILGGICFIALLLMLSSLFKIKVWIFTKSKRENNLSCIGFLSNTAVQEVPEVRLSGNPSGKAIGRVKMGEKDENAYIELLNTPYNDDSEKPRYRTYGFITQNGLIYKQPVESRKPVLIGYTARPSTPNEPTSIGERNWKSLWLKCQLNVYAGHPPVSDEETAQKAVPLEVPNDSQGEESEVEGITIQMEDKKNVKKENSKSKDKKAATSGEKPIAYSTYTGIHSSKKDAMPPEARSAAFGMLYNLYNKQNYQEYYKAPSFGWKDTALLAAFIYAIIYAVWYMLATKIFGVRFIGFKAWLDLPVFATYFAIWCIVRWVKIECIERSDTIQPKIDLFNKILGQKGFDITIIVCCIIALTFTGTYYRFNFLPLALVVMTAIIINMSLYASKERWMVKNPLISDDEEDENPEDIKIPSGDIERIYEWDLDSPSRKDVKGKLAVYFDGRYIADLRFMNPFYNQRKDKATHLLIEEMFNYMREHKSISARSRYVVSQIKRISAQNQLLDEEALQFTLDFVQEPNIRFTMNRDSHSINKFEDYIRFPDETLYDKEADSNSKALLAAVLFHFLGHNVVFLLSRMQHHGAIGIQMRPEWREGDKVFGMPIEEATFEHNGKRYLFCETTKDGCRIGGTIYGMRFEDFEDRIEIPIIAEDTDEDNNETRTCLYNWDLDSAAGNKLHGSFTLEFEPEDIEELRGNNPFVSYGQDGVSYEDKVQEMFDYIRQSSGRLANVKKLASYIRKTVEAAKLPEIDLVQFALDFCQAPNITYRVDEESKGINFAKEYMRFPDEVLYDKEGDCDCKSSLTAALLSSLGYRVIIMLSEKLGHAGIGVEYNPEWHEHIQADDKSTVLREHNGKTYLYCETTGDGYRVGQIKDNDSIQDFETIIEIL